VLIGGAEFGLVRACYQQMPGCLPCVGLGTIKALIFALQAVTVV
jgi:hypothetical protein